MDNEQRLKELERRRRRGGRLLAAGVAQAEVARRVGVTRATVSRLIWMTAPPSGNQARTTPPAFLDDGCRITFTSVARSRAMTPCEYPHLFVDP
jgi:transposase